MKNKGTSFTSLCNELSKEKGYNIYSVIVDDNDRTMNAWGEGDAPDGAKDFCTGCQYTDRINGIVYINTGDETSASWDAIGSSGGGSGAGLPAGTTVSGSKIGFNGAVDDNAIVTVSNSGTSEILSLKRTDTAKKTDFKITDAGLLFGVGDSSGADTEQITVTYDGKIKTAATTSGDASTTLVTKGYADSLAGGGAALPTGTTVSGSKIGFNGGVDDNAIVTISNTGTQELLSLKRTDIAYKSDFKITGAGLFFGVGDESGGDTEQINITLDGKIKSSATVSSDDSTILATKGYVDTFSSVVCNVYRNAYAVGNGTIIFDQDGSTTDTNKKLIAVNDGNYNKTTGEYTVAKDGTYKIDLEVFITLYNSTGSSVDTQSEVGISIVNTSGTLLNQVVSGTNDDSKKLTIPNGSNKSIRHTATLTMSLGAGTHKIRCTANGEPILSPQIGHNDTTFTKVTNMRITRL